MPDAYIKNLPQEDENPAGNETPPQEGNEPPTEGTDPPQGGDTPPTEGTDPPQGGDTPPAEGTDPPQGGDEPPTEGTDPPQGGDTPPAEGTDPPQGGDEPPTEGTDPPQEGDTPTEGDTPAGDENSMQKILDDLRESLNRKDADVTALTDSIRSLVDAMDTAPLSVSELPFSGWRDWWYPVKMEYSVYPKGAGYWMEASELFETPEALLARYNELLGLCHTSGTLNDFYVRYIWAEMDSDGDEYIVYDYEAKDEPVTDVEVPFEGWESWAYPITVDFTVHPWGAGYDMDVTETYDTPEAFKTDYNKNVKLCGDGGTLKDYRIRRITDSGGIMVYDGEQTEEPPAEDLTPAILETLQSIDARLEDIDSLSANTLDHYEDTLHHYEEQNALLTNTLALNMAVLFFEMVKLFCNTYKEKF